jgi:hypothetical protein
MKDCLVAPPVGVRDEVLELRERLCAEGADDVGRLAHLEPI